MATYKIVTDSCCDFTAEQYARLDLTYVPLTLLYKGQVCESFTEESELKSFYDGIRAGEMPTTSAANPDNWAKAMEPILKAGQDILCITFTSAMSTTYQSAVIAAQDLKDRYPEREILVIDSLCAALGQGLLVYYTCKKRDEGLSLSELAAWVEENKLKLCHWVTIDDLNHLKRGGRVSATTAFVGTMIGIKPIIRVDDGGRLETYSKIRGRKAAIEYLVQKLDDHITDCDTVFIAHGDCPEDAKKLEELIRKARPEIRNIQIGYVGGVIGAHTGPGVLVTFFLGDGR